MNIVATNILIDFRKSGIKDLGKYALKTMEKYDDIEYHLLLKDAINGKGQRVVGTVIAPTEKAVMKAVKAAGIVSGYRILPVDLQHEYFLCLGEIRDFLETVEREINVKTGVTSKS